MLEGFERTNQRLGKNNWRTIAWWSDGDLRRLGIDTINLLCALGLPGAESMDINFCLHKIDEWTKKIRAYTAERMHVYECYPEKFANSLAYFKALCLIMVLQRDCGVRYNPAKEDPNVPLEVADSFIFGIIQGAGGTCGSLPVLYCAVGHRLGYPMFLMDAKGPEAKHSFIRWDDGETRFNIEGSGKGMATPGDDHYRTGMYLLLPETEREGCFLKAKDMRQSFATFLEQRAWYFRKVKAYQQAVEAMVWTAALHPENQFYISTAKWYYREWFRSCNQRKPPGFPEIIIKHIERRRFPASVPLWFETDVCVLETMECLLKDAKHDANFWEPLRRDQKPASVPLQVECEVDEKGGKTVRFVFEKKTSRNLGDFANA